LPKLSTTAVCVIAGGVIAIETVAAASPVPEKTGVLILVLLPHNAADTTGTKGGVVSKIVVENGIVVGVILPARSLVVIAIEGAIKVFGAVSVHTTTPVEVAIVSLQLVPAIVIIAPCSTPVHDTTTDVVPLEGLGVAVQVGAKGGILSSMYCTGAGIVLPEKSLTVAVGLDVTVPGVISVHVILPVASAIVGTQLVPGIDNDVPSLTFIQVITIIIVPLLIAGTEVQTGGVKGGIISLNLKYISSLA
jgi:hypothetical protein